MASPKQDNHKAACVLLDASLQGDRKACENHKITDRTLRNYRTALRSRIVRLTRLRQRRTQCR